ncbi:hypothetical protein GCM10017667_25670 [Streptomyces filamentosus]|uniref:Redoxin domain-containing protein n=1 Tax=Streptomyces filamentosus TaxID=67294 RepID=A0A919BIV5_STRFL|nr:hypothetical protein GCM10017667_25670 [Streptomyces filamentosus]
MICPHASCPHATARPAPRPPRDTPAPPTRPHRSTRTPVTAAARKRARVRAPELIGKGGWLNAGGDDLPLADPRGKVLVLDFWIY